MAKFEEAIALYTSFMTEKLKMTDIKAPVLTAIAEMLGDNIYDADASLVACSDNGELKRVKQLFLIDTLKLDNTPALDTAIKAVCEKMGKGNRKKFRVVFYYLLLQQFGLENQFPLKTVAEKIPTVAAKPIATIKKEEVKTPVKTTITTIIAQAKPVIATTVKATVTVPVSFEEKVDAYKALIVNELHFNDIHYDLLANLAHTVGETSIVDLASATEREHIKENFLKGRLGLHHDNNLDEAIETVNNRMGNTPKHRPVFYYLLTKHTGREWVILEPVESNLF